MSRETKKTKIKMEDQNQNNQEATNSNVMLSQSSIMNLRNTVPWIKFISIMGFIACGFLVIAALVMLIFGFSYGTRYGTGMTLGLFFVYIIMALIILFPNIYLYKYGLSVREFCELNDNNSLDKAFIMQRKYWQYMGVLLIIYLVIMVIGLIVVLNTGAWD